MVTKIEKLAMVLNARGGPEEHQSRHRKCRVPLVYMYGYEDTNNVPTTPYKGTDRPTRPPVTRQAVFFLAGFRLNCNWAK